MTIFFDRESNTIPLATFWENYLLNKYNFNPAYQRESVWSEEKQSYLIDTILKNFPMPPVFLHQKIDDKTGRTQYDVIDGKQRLQSIIRFINNEITVATEFNNDFDDERLAGATFKDLDREELAEYKRRLWRYSIPVEYIDTPTGAIIDNIFDRLNRNGEPLKGQELRNAKYHGTGFLTLVENLAELTFWSKRLEQVDKARMEHYEFISELLFVILEDGPLDATDEVIDRYYDKYTSSPPDLSNLRQRFEVITNFLDTLQLDYEGYKITGVSHLYGLWCFARYGVNERLNPSEANSKLKELFDELRSGDIEDANVGEYKASMSSGTKSKYRRSRRLDALISFVCS